MYDNDFFTSGFFIGYALVIFLIIAVPAIFYLITLQKTLNAIDPSNRLMPSGQVWLLLIPVFNWVWQFIVVQRIADSIKAECERLNITMAEARPTFTVGQTKNILSLCTLIPVVGSLCGLGFLISWIVYWIKIAEYKNLIIANKENTFLEAENGIFHDNRNV